MFDRQNALWLNQGRTYYKHIELLKLLQKGATVGIKLCPLNDRLQGNIDEVLKQQLIYWFTYDFDDFNRPIPYSVENLVIQIDSKNFGKHETYLYRYDYKNGVVQSLRKESDFSYDFINKFIELVKLTNRAKNIYFVQYDPYTFTVLNPQFIQAPCFLLKSDGSVDEIKEKITKHQARKMTKSIVL